MTASLEAELAGLDDQLLPVLLPALQAYTQAAAMAGASRSLSLREWQEAEASLCGDMLQLFVTSGAIAAAAGVSGPSAAELAGWMGGRQGEESAAQESAAAAAWQLLSQHVATTLHAADRSFLLAAVDRANGGMDATGVSHLAMCMSNACCLSTRFSPLLPPPGRGKICLTLAVGKQLAEGGSSCHESVPAPSCRLLLGCMLRPAVQPPFERRYASQPNLNLNGTSLAFLLHLQA